MRKANNGTTLDIPKGLSRKGRTAAAIIKKLMNRNHFETGGCKTFYTPKEWKARSEKWGTTSELVFVYDGGDLYSIMSNEFGYQTSDELQQDLQKIGLYYEECTCWYSAIYEV